MWYLQADTLIIIAGLSVFTAVMRGIKDKLWPKLPINCILPILELLVLAYVSKGLMAFYSAYMIVGLILARLLERPRHSPMLFFLCCCVAVFPIFISRSQVFGVQLPYLYVFVGIAFNMLKLADVFFYVHYSGEHIKSLTYINYMLFIPVFTSGPIFRYRDFKRTYNKPLPMNGDELSTDVKRIIRGLFKKVVLLQLLTMVQARLMQGGQHFYISFALVIVSYFTLYLDLSGYSDIAIGFGRIAGYNVPENFKKPWEAPSFTRFWRSWHSTLSDWIREHIYILVAKKKLDRVKSALIALVTMIVMALWHGFNMPYFVVCGLYLGGLLALENLLGLTTATKKNTSRGVYYLRCFAVNFLFGINTLVFTMPRGGIVDVLRGFLSL